MTSVQRLTDVVPIPSPINTGVSSAKQSTMLTLLGNPRASYNTECRDIDQPRLREMVVLENVGPFKVRGLGPAVQSLRQVLAEAAAEVPAVHAALGTAGMLCARLVRGSTTAISNHSWGTAIDLTLEDVLDRRGDGLVQVGLSMLAPIFNRHGWFWGAGFRTEDAMHFEVGDELMRRWHREGRLGASTPGTVEPEEILSIGDRGPDVVTLQQRLNAHGVPVAVDGDFGLDTRAAVMAFQTSQGIRADGVAGAQTRKALGL